MTSALSSVVVHAMELLEFPNEIPMAVRSPGFAPFVAASVADILIDYEISIMYADVRAAVKSHRLIYFENLGTFFPASRNFASAISQ